MIITVDGITYESEYYPFFRIERKDTYELYGIRYPSGNIDEFVVYENSFEELKRQASYLIHEYAHEDDEMLTTKAKELKNEIKKLFRPIN